MLGGADNPNGELPSYITGADTRRSSELKVFILDTDAAQYYPFDGERVCYDGVSIPESEIWSEHPDRSKHGVVLVAESITGKAA